MSHRALIAERQSNDRFNVYHSRNGAENIHLLDELRESLNVHGRVDFESLTGKTIPKMGQQMARVGGSGYQVEFGDTGNIVEPRPLAVNVRRRNLLVGINLLQYEVLYVVDNGEVNAYWLAWTYPDVIRPWRNHVEMDVYDAGGVPTQADEMMEYLNETDPIRTITDFERGWLSDNLVREVVEDYHRWMYELHGMAVDKRSDDEVDDAGAAQRLITTSKHCLAFRVDSNSVLVPQSLPFIIPIRIGSPPDASSTQIRKAAARTRFSIGAGLNAAESVSEEDLHRAYDESLTEIVDEYADQVATEFIPDQLSEAIAASSRRRSDRDQMAPGGSDGV